jgi:hypothetical protein
MLLYKKEKGWNNIIITKQILQNIVLNNEYQLLCDEDDVIPSHFGALEKIRDIVVLILKKYVETIYLNKKREWEKRNLGLSIIREDDEITRRSYLIKVTDKETAVADEIRSSVTSGDIYNEWSSTGLKNVYLDRHLYQPLLTVSGNIMMTPSGINEGEMLFIEDLRKYISNNSSGINGNTIFILRNLTRGGGIGFFETHGFYPDFILWIKDGSKQDVVFIDPKGLVYVDGINNPKLQLYKHLKDLTLQFQTKGITLNSFIISVTPYQTIRQVPWFSSISLEEFEQNHVLFPYNRNKYDNDINYVEKMFNIIRKEKSPID